MIPAIAVAKAQLQLIQVRAELTMAAREPPPPRTREGAEKTGYELYILTSGKWLTPFARSRLPRPHKPKLSPRSTKRPSVFVKFKP
jgi:hypothetical protein